MFNQDFTLIRTNDAEMVFEVTSLPAGGLSAGTLSLTLWRDRQDAAAFLTKANDQFTITQNGDAIVNGIASVLVLHTDLDELPAYTVDLLYDVQFIETATSRPTRVATGTLTIKP